MAVSELVALLSTSSPWIVFIALLVLGKIRLEREINEQRKVADIWKSAYEKAEEARREQDRAMRAPLETSQVAVQLLEGLQQRGRDVR